MSSLLNNGPRRDSIIKPILLNKDEITPIHASKHDVEPANNFEQIHPKDDCELRKERSCGSSSTSIAAAADEMDLSTPPSPRVLGNNSTNISNNKSSSGTNTPVDDAQSQQDSPHVGGGKRGNTKFNSQNSKQQRKQEYEEASMTPAKVEKIINKLPLNSPEIQNLIDVLLNKQPAGDTEWVNNKGGKNSGDQQSVAGLKKQVEIKDKLLAEEQITVSTLQLKLKELRNEISGEKAKFAGVRRQLEEQVQGKMGEVQKLTMRLRQVEGIGMQEKGELQKQLQRMQIKFKDVQDEYEAIKADYRNYR